MKSFVAPGPARFSGGPPRWRTMLCCLLLVLAAAGPSSAEEAKKLAVYDFALVDFSAAGNPVQPDARDAKHLAEVTEEAKKWLSESGRYRIVDAAPAHDAIAQQRELHDCDGCVGPITKELGADVGLVGTVTRISRTEYTVLIQFFEAGSGKLLARYFSGLRMGADYSWSRGVRSVMKSQVLAKSDE